MYASAQRNFRASRINIEARAGAFVIESKEAVMLYYAAVFLVIAIIAGIFGFGGIAAGAFAIAKIVFFVFLVLFVASLIIGLARRT